MDAIDYYNKYASEIFEETVSLDMEQIRREFLGYLEEGDTILDLGCGSGRDSLAFYEQGYDVTPLDASEEMCKLAEIHTGLEVLRIKYEEMEFDEVFDGIWGCAALIHVPEAALDGILERIVNALCRDGILFLSFRKGESEGFWGGRYFCDYTEEKLERVFNKNGRLKLEKLWVTDDARGGKEQQWLNVLAKKLA